MKKAIFLGVVAALIVASCQTPSAPASVPSADSTSAKVDTTVKVDTAKATKVDTLR